MRYPRLDAPERRTGKDACGEEGSSSTRSKRGSALEGMRPKENEDRREVYDLRKHTLCII